MDDDDPKDMLEVPRTTPVNDGLARALRYLTLPLTICFIVTSALLYLGH